MAKPGPSNRSNMGSQVEPGVIARIVAGAKYIVTGNEPQVWFGPGNPMPMVTTEAERPSVVGRQFDYPVYTNTNITPKQAEGITFQMLRSLADNYDLLRIIIETRKDQVEKLKFSIRPKDKDAKPDDTCKEITDFFAQPDKENSWNTWTRMLLEDLLVIDAPCLYPRMNRGGKLYALEPVDGATIKRLLDETGRTPVSPEPAYQQILKGLPAVDYTREELMYRPRNKRTNKAYGFSPVEQVIMTVNIAMNRQLAQISYYTHGSRPDLMFGVPDTWNADQIKGFSDWFNSLLSGNAAEKAKAKFVPGGMTPIDTKDKLLKDQMDEWLARIICFCFSIPPTPFVNQVNRATSETLKQQAADEGLQPLMQWIKSVHDDIISQYWSPDYELVWENDAALNPLETAEVNQIYLANKVLHPNEVREELGRDPLTDEQKADLNPPPPPGLMGGNLEDPLGDKKQSQPKLDTEEDDLDDEEDPEALKGGAVSTLKKSMAPIDKDHVLTAAEAYQKILDHFFKHWMGQITPILVGHVDKVAKASAKQQVDELPWDDFNELVGPSQKYLVSVATISSRESLAALGITDETVMDRLREYSVAYAENRAAEMVGKKWSDGELVDNDNAEWVITDVVRDDLQDLIIQSQKEGWSGPELAERIEESFGFSESRAEMIARTEMANADINSTVEGWRQSDSVVAKRFEAAPDCCDECQESDGEEVGLDESFTNGDPPIHPNCRCGIRAVMKSEED